MAPEIPKTSTMSKGEAQVIEEEVEKPEPTEDEWDGFWIIKAILTEITDPSRVTMRDAKSYCAILLDDNNRKPLCRLFFHSKQKYITVFDGEKAEGEKILITDLNDLFKQKEHFKKTVAKYDKIPVK